MKPLYRRIRGTTRLVYVIPAWGIAFKFARFRLKANVRDLWGDLNFVHTEGVFKNDPARRRKLVLQKLREYTYKILQGVMSNVSEYRFYRSIDLSIKPLLQPTYFSFFGIVNIQEMGCPSIDRGICEMILEIIGDDFDSDSHVLNVPQNFHAEDGVVRVLDYAGRETQKIITKHGLAILNHIAQFATMKD